MEQEKPRQAGTRKAYTAKGERGQKMMSFRLDIENADYLASKPNKGRFINDLLAQARVQETGSTGGE